MNHPISSESPAGLASGKPEEGGVEPVYHALRLIFGVMFICLGLFLYSQVLTAFADLLAGTSNFPLLEKFHSAEARTLSPPGTGEKISLPPVFFLGMGYGVVVFIGSVVVSIGNNLIRGGVSLIQPDAKALIRRLRIELGKKTGQ